MFNYIRAEIYKLLHRPYTYIALGVMMALEALYASMFAFHNAHSMATPFGGAIITIIEMGAIGFCTCLLTGDIVFAGQYKNSTLKNEVSFGLSRTQIYLGKLAFFLGLCAVCLPMESESAAFYATSEALAIVGYFLSVGLPLWIGAQAALCMCLFLVNGEMASSFLYVGIVFVLESFIDLAGLLIQGPVGNALLKAVPYFPVQMLNGAKSVVGDVSYLGRAWLVGAFWVIVCTVVGLYGFNRKEIK